jgi:hypothetical protein
MSSSPPKKLEGQEFHLARAWGIRTQIGESVLEAADETNKVPVHGLLEPPSTNGIVTEDAVKIGEWPRLPL